MVTSPKSTPIPNPTHPEVLDGCPRCAKPALLAQPGDICNGCRHAETKAFPRCADPACQHLEAMHHGHACLGCLQERARPVCKAYVAQGCLRCRATDVELRGGICGTCGQDLIDEAKGEAAAEEAERQVRIFGNYGPVAMHDARARGEGGRFA